MIPDITSLKNDKSALTNLEIEKFCKLNNIPYSFLDLTEVPNTDKEQAFVHTGEKKNDINKGTINHWLYYLDGKIFDSYGDRSAYNIPENIKFFPNKRLQEFGTNPCGAYCLSFASFINLNPENVKESGEKIIGEYEEMFGLTGNQKENDIEIKNWYNKNNDPKNN